MGYENASWGAGEWLAMSAMMLLFWGPLVGLAVWALHSLRRESRRRSTHGGRGIADGVLAERYARGEIGEDEFKHTYELLHNTSGRGTQWRKN